MLEATIEISGWVSTGKDGSLNKSRRPIAYIQCPFWTRDPLVSKYILELVTVLFHEETRRFNMGVQQIKLTNKNGFHKLSVTKEIKIIKSNMAKCIIGIQIQFFQSDLIYSRPKPHTISPPPFGNWDE